MTAAERSGLSELAKSSSDRQFPYQRPRDAATLIIVDRSGAAPKVLFGKRNEKHRFMPGKFVFPGGRIEAGDRRMPVAGALSDAAVARLMKRVQRPTELRCRALALAAIRETFEETGLMVGTKEFGAPDFAPVGAWADFAAQGVFPTLDRLHFVARAITPPNRSKRFDTRFFAVDASDIAHRVEGVVGPDTELVELVWTPLAQARDLDLPGITRAVLKELAGQIEAGFTETLPAPFFYERRLERIREEL